MNTVDSSGLDGDNPCDDPEITCFLDEKLLPTDGGLYDCTNGGIACLGINTSNGSMSITPQSGPPPEGDFAGLLGGLYYSTSVPEGAGAVPIPPQTTGHLQRRFFLGVHSPTCAILVASAFLLQPHSILVLS
jgi:hypothetical protein